jgi:tetratricopeptide (TPR) repeat protein
MGIPAKKIEVKEKIIMPTKRRLPILIGYIFIMIAFIGCVPSRIETSATPLESLRPGYDVAYYPQIQPGMTFDSIKNDLIRTISSTNIPDQDGRILALANGCAVLNDRLEIKYSSKLGPASLTLFYYHLLYSKVVVEVRQNGRGGYHINLPELPSLGYRKLSNAQKIADALFFIQQQMKKIEEGRNNQLVRFEPAAAEYRALKVKPPVPEEQRRIIVQANALSQQRQYGKAIEQYLKAIALDPTSYPPAYFNIALLSAQDNNPLSAIFYMKHYLLLVPGASDARSAQDKIYEWELVIGK